MNTTDIPDWITGTSIDTSNVVEHPSKHAKEAKRIYKEIERMQFDTVFERVMSDLSEGIPVKTTLRNDPRGLNYGKFIRWVSNDPARLQIMRRAQELGAEVLEAEIINIADGRNADGSEPSMPEDIARSTLRVKTRQFLMAVWNRPRYDAATKQGSGAVSVNIDLSALGLDLNPPQGHTIDYAQEPIRVDEDDNSNTQPGEVIVDERLMGTSV